MSDARRQLLEIVRQMRRTLEWQGAIDDMGSLPASEEAREAFREQLEAHRHARREQMRASLMDEDDEDDRDIDPSSDDNTGSSPSEDDEDGANPWSELGSHRSPEQSARAETAREQPRSEEHSNETTDNRESEMADEQPTTNAEKMQWLRNYMGDCRRCPLWENRTNLVFGEGDPEADLVFVGEAPGYNEDQQGRPFVGRAGTLLDKMIGAMGLERQETYICNVLKSRPPDNRDPRPDEVEACIPFLKKQIDIIQPEVICTLGRPATQNLLETDRGIGELRGTWQTYDGIDVMPTYHPAYLLRNASMKPKTWDDLQLIIDRLDLPGPNG